MKNKLAIFDMDGTLFDTRTALYESYKKAAEINSKIFSVGEKFFYQNCFGKNYKIFLTQYTNWDITTVESVHDTKIKIYPDILKKFARKNESLFDILHGLKINYRIALVTSASKSSTMDLLNYFSCSEDFDLILTNEDVIHKKPDAEGFLKAMQNFSVTAENTLIFEDSDECIIAAKKICSNVYKVELF